MQQLTPRLMNWASILEDKTREQALTASRMPFIFPHLALMPDAHLGKGATVGSVIPTLGAIMPAAVGVDIGCGMIALRTQWHRDDFASRPGGLAPLREHIERVIPLSAGHQNTAVTRTHTQTRIDKLGELRGADEATKIAPNWHLQLGSLGSGNHFIEVTVDEDGAVWLFLHSGSRGVGNKLAMHHIRVAQKLMQQWWISLPDDDLANLVEGTPEFTAYIRDLRWAQAFALQNREEMMDRLVDAVEVFMGDQVQELQRINCHHNFTESEVHFGKRVWLSRKGAISARTGEWGLIPGSMGTASYVVQGKGNKLALESSPHGAGRNYSRNAARKKFTMADLSERMTGIEWRVTSAFLDEHPDAYKDVDVVMADASDLVTPVHELHQILNVKGD